MPSFNIKHSDINRMLPSAVLSLKLYYLHLLKEQASKPESYKKVLPFHSAHNKKARGDSSGLGYEKLDFQKESCRNQLPTLLVKTVPVSL